MVQIMVCRMLPLVTLMPCHYLNQCWNIADFILKSKCQLNVNYNREIVIQENEFKDVLCKMVTILCRSQCI